MNWTKATLKLELANLMVELASAKIEAVTMQTLLFDAEQKIKVLEDDLKDKSSFAFNGGLYWKDGDKTAFCPKCFEVNQLKAHMVHRKSEQLGFYWFCNNCNLRKYG